MKVLGWIALLGLTSGGLFGCRSERSLRAAVIEKVQARVVSSRQEPVAVALKVTGTLQARESATLSAQVMGRVQQVLVREGDPVRAGQTLVILDDATLKSASEQAEAAVKAAENQQIAAQTNADLAASTLVRYQQLQAQKSVSLQEMDEVTRRAEAAAAQVNALRAQTNAVEAQQAGAHAMLSYTHIVAPFAGVVTARMVDAGALASPGVPLVQMDGAGPLQLHVPIAESAIFFVRKGMKVAVSIDGAADVEFGIVSEIVPAADASTHSFLVKIDLTSYRALRAGMYATAEIPTGTRQAVLAPRSAIVMRGSLACAYVLDTNNIAQLRYVTVGAVQANEVEILSGIAGNERLIDDPADRDFSGKQIGVQL